MTKKKTENENEIKFYSLQNILKQNADYNIIFGERSNGKTYALLEYAIKNFVAKGTQTAYIRRWREDLKGKRAETLFQNHIQNGFVSRETNDNYNNIVYKNGKFYLSKETENEKLIYEKPFCYCFALSEMEHDKSTSYPEITTIIFDEFLTRRYYLPDEFILFMNLLSTIIRQRNNVKIFMLGNTVNKYCPYFTEMGLKNVTIQKQGTIDVYSFGVDGCKIAVEYAAPVETKKASNKYFCFDNDKLKMITGGKWELEAYPHLPVKYKPKDIQFIYYIIFGENILQCEIINNGFDYFTFIHQKTTPIKDTENSLIYSLESNGKPNFKRRLISSLSDIEKKIAAFFVADKVFYQNNEIGEIVRNYIQVSNKTNLL